MDTGTIDDRAPAPMPPPDPIVEATGLVKRYGGHVAVAGVDLAISSGEIFGILGPNGAGKTTTLEMIEGLRAPDAGSVRVAGLDPVSGGERVRRLIGVQLQSTALFDYLSAAELVALFAGLYDVDASPDRVAGLLGLVGLGEKRDARADELSGGQRQRLAIALALVNAPRVVLLDEPTTGLDPAARRALWETIRDVRAGGATVLLTTHYLEEAEVLCDRVAIMDAGRIVACDAPAALVRRLGAAATIRAAVAAPFPPGALARLPAVVAATEEPTDGGTAVRLRSTDAQATLVALLNLAERNGIALSGLASSQATLEDVYLELTGKAYENGVEESRSREDAKTPRHGGEAERKKR